MSAALPTTAAPPGKANRRRDIVCSFCQKHFARAEHLDRHLRSHTKEKPFECGGCGKHYSRYDVLLRHQRHAGPASQCYSSAAAHRAAGPSVTSRTDFRRASAVDAPSGSSTLNGEIHHSGDGELNAPRMLLSPQAQCMPGLAYSHALSGVIGNDAPQTLESTALVPDTVTREDASAWRSVDAPQDQFMPDDWTNLNDFWALDQNMHADLFDNSYAFDHAGPLDSAALEDPGRGRAATVSELWFTRNLAAPSATVTRLNSPHSSEPGSPSTASMELNVHGRSSMQRLLRFRSLETTIPSTEFLNTCIRLFFSKAQPLLPVVHPATFRPSRDNTAVTLAMCAMGTLFMWTERALDAGMHLFRRLVKSTLLYWDEAKMSGSIRLVRIIQGAVIGQAFAILSGNSHLLATADAFQGPPIAFARSQGLFNVKSSYNADIDSAGPTLEQHWQEYVQNEEHIRIALMLRIVDAELAVMMRHEPLMSINSQTLVATSSEKAFTAQTARDWQNVCLAERRSHAETAHHDTSSTLFGVLAFDLTSIPRSSTLTAYAYLEELNTRASSARANRTSQPDVVSMLYRQLANFHRHFISSYDSTQSDVHGLIVLWHSVHIFMLADLDAVEHFVGRDGTRISATQQAIVNKWVESEDCPRAAAHAVLIAKHVESRKVLEEHPIHFPRLLFTAGMILFCFSKLGTKHWEGRLGTLDQMHTEFHLWATTTSLVLQEASESFHPRFAFQKTLYAIVQLLQRTGSWRLSRSLAGILGSIVDNEME